VSPEAAYKEDGHPEFSYRNSRRWIWVSLPPSFAKPPTQLRDIRSAPAIKVGTLILSGGPLFRERRRSFARDPLTPLARPGSIHPLAGPPLSNLPLAHPMRFAPFRLPQGRLPSRKVSRRAFVVSPAPQLVLDLLPALAWKTLFGCLRETSCSRSSSRTPSTRSRTDPAHWVGLY